jgi:hypothetical protein
MLRNCNEKYKETLYAYGYSLGVQLNAQFAGTKDALIQVVFTHGCAYGLASGFLDSLVSTPIEKKIRVYAVVPYFGRDEKTYMYREPIENTASKHLVVVFGTWEMATNLEPFIKDGLFFILDELLENNSTSITLCSPAIEEPILRDLDWKYRQMNFAERRNVVVCSNAETFSVRRDSDLNTVLLHSAIYSFAKQSGADFLQAVKKFRSFVPL